MIRDISILIAGRAGDGVLFTGKVLAKILKRSGWEVSTYRDFPSNKEKGYDPFDKKQALERVLSSAKIPVGLIYQEQKPSYEKLILPDRKKPVAFGNLKIDIRKFEEILREFR